MTDSINNCIHFISNFCILVAFILGFGSIFREIYLDIHFPEKTNGRYIVNNFINYYISALLMIQLSEYIYFEVAEKLVFKGSNFLLSSGLSLTIILICTGRLVDSFHRFTFSKAYKKLKANRPGQFKPIKEVEKTYIICWSSIVSIITSFRFHYMISLYAIAIFLGRFFWYDSNMSGSFSDYLKGVFNPMDDSNPDINGSIIKIKKWILVGSFLYLAFYTALVKALDIFFLWLIRLLTGPGM